VCLLAVLFVGGMLPWYTLRVLPVVTVGSAKVNLIDVLVACAVLAAFPAIVRLLLVERPLPVLLVCAFIVYMATVPFVLGLRDPGAAPTAVRELRGLAFYALAVAFAAGGYRARDFRVFAGAYVAGVLIAVAAVFVHLRWLVPLPGYTPDVGLAPVGFAIQSFSWNEHISLAPTIPVAAAAGYRIDYLDWTVPLVAVILGWAGALTAATRAMKAVWAVSVLAVVWYLLVSGARSPQIVAVASAVALGLILRRRRVLGRRALAAVALATVALAGVMLRPPGALRGVTGPVRTTVLRWGQLGEDASIRLRVKEIIVSLPEVARHPALGEGLGGVIPIPEFAVEGQIPRSIASGYGFLLIKTGALGLLLYLALAASAVRAGWAQIRAGRDDAAWPGARVGIVGIAALLVLNLTHTVVDIPEGAIAFSLFFGMIMAGVNGPSIR